MAGTLQRKRCVWMKKEVKRRGWKEILRGQPASSGIDGGTLEETTGGVKPLVKGKRKSGEAHWILSPEPVMISHKLGFGHKERGESGCVSD